MLAGLLAANAFATSSLQAQGNFYSHGDPTTEEQYLLEMINRDRANPGQAGDRFAVAPSNNEDCARLFRFFPGNLAGMNAEFHSIPVRPPMGFNSSLIASARAHTQDMLNMGVASHSGSDGSSEITRARAQGYSSTLVTENVADTMFSVFGIDYAFATDFAQPGLGHRHNMMNDNTWYVTREAGIGISDLNPRPDGGYVTQDFGNAGVALATGVSFRDYDNDNIYSVGEGLAGMVVTSPASSRFTVTSASGGYSLPLDLLPDYTAGTQSVDLVFADLNGQVISRQSVVLSGSTQGGGVGRAYDNAKVDLVYAADGSLRSPAALVANVVSIVLVHPPAGVGAKGTFKISRTGDLSGNLLVRYKAKGGAVAGRDYTALAGSVIIPAGSATVKVNVKSLVGVDPGSLLTLKLKGGDGYSLGAPASAAMPLLLTIP